LLHLLSERLGALAQPFEGAALGLDSLTLAFLSASELLFCVAHGALSIFQTLLGAHAEPTHALLQILELFPQRLLALLQAFRLVALLLTLLLPTLSPLLKSAVPQFLLIPHHLVELVQRAVHFPRHLVAPVVPARRLEVLQKVLQLFEHALRVGHVPGAGHFLHLVEHALQILRGDHSLVGIRSALILGVVATPLLLIGKFLKKAVQRSPELIHQLSDLVF
jgi:hypothetical protein